MTVRYFLLPGHRYSTSLAPLLSSTWHCLWPWQGLCLRNLARGTGVTMQSSTSSSPHLDGPFLFSHGPFLPNSVSVSLSKSIVEPSGHFKSNDSPSQISCRYPALTSTCLDIAPTPIKTKENTNASILSVLSVLYPTEPWRPTPPSGVCAATPAGCSLQGVFTSSGLCVDRAAESRLGPWVITCLPPLCFQP